MSLKLLSGCPLFTVQGSNGFFSKTTFDFQFRDAILKSTTRYSFKTGSTSVYIYSTGVGVQGLVHLVAEITVLFVKKIKSGLKENQTQLQLSRIVTPTRLRQIQDFFSNGSNINNTSAVRLFSFSIFL